MLPKWMGAIQNLSPRFVQEFKVMATDWSEAVLHLPTVPEGDAYARHLVCGGEDSYDGLPYWELPVYVNMKGVPEENRHHVAHLVYPNDYPNVAPSVYVLTYDKLYQPPHVLSTGWDHTFDLSNGKHRICIYSPRDKHKHSWNPAKSTASTTAAWAATWFFSAQAMRLTGNRIAGHEDRMPVDPEEQERDRIAAENERRRIAASAGNNPARVSLDSWNHVNNKKSDTE